LKAAGKRVVLTHDVANTFMPRLSKSQLEEFWERGFITGLSVFDAGEVEALRRGAEELFREWRRDPPDGLGLEGRFPCILNLARTPAILDLVECILGPDISLFNSQLVFKDAGEGEYFWHQDATANHAEFLNPAAVPGGMPLTLRLWLAVDDADRGNGTLRIAPGSHKCGLLHHEEARWRDYDGAPRIPPAVFDASNAEYIELKAGQFCLFHDLAVHGSDPNDSDRRRWAISLHYTRPDVRFDPAFWPDIEPRPLRVRGCRPESIES
jgi:ectoine hydroxylase-related dioxygenase (phytanoyl-CoA dioxygenase family)